MSVPCSDLSRMPSLADLAWLAAAHAASDKDWTTSPSCGPTSANGSTSSDHTSNSGSIGDASHGPALTQCLGTLHLDDAFSPVSQVRRCS